MSRFKTSSFRRAICSAFSGSSRFMSAVSSAILLWKASRLIASPFTVATGLSFTGGGGGL